MILLLKVLEAKQLTLKGNLTKNLRFTAESVFKEFIRFTSFESYFNVKYKKKKICI